MVINADGSYYVRPIDLVKYKRPSESTYVDYNLDRNSVYDASFNLPPVIYERPV